MKLRAFVLVVSADLLLAAGGTLAATDAPPTTRDVSAIHSASPKQKDEELALEGEKRFRANCGRCHQPPHKFPPAVISTAIRHMRVRANITDEDMRLILRFMTQ